MVIPDGFPGERLRVMPRPAVRAALARPGTAQVLVTDAGCYPKALSHGMSRPDGVAETIVIFCSAGAGWCTIDGLRRTVQGGQAVLIPAGTAHAYGADPADPWTIWWLHLAGRDLAAFVAGVGVSPSSPIRVPTDPFRIVDLAGEVLNALDRDFTLDSQLAASGAAWHLLTLLAGAPGPEHDGGAAAAVERVRDYLRRHLDERISVAGLASMAGLSPSHFGALFRRQVGVPVIRYLTGLRMARARDLLDTTDLPVGEIAARTGYRDPFYFSRQFRAVHHTTPLRYRTLHKG